MKLIFLGSPGVGKGTLADMLKERKKITKISTGDLLREHVKNQTALGKEAQKYMDHGNLVPDNIVIEMVKEEIEDIENYILDGFPRTLPQAQALGKITKIDKVVNYTATDKTIIQRLSGRRTCPKCNAIYHIQNIPPKKPGVCDKCNAKLIQRKDDKPEAIKERLKVYRKETAPLIEYYQNKGLLVDVDTEKPLEEIYKDTLKAIK